MAEFSRGRAAFVRNAHRMDRRLDLAPQLPFEIPIRDPHA